MRVSKNFIILINYQTYINKDQNNPMLMTVFLKLKIIKISLEPVASWLHRFLNHLSIQLDAFRHPSWKIWWLLFVKLRIPSSHLTIGFLKPLLCWHSSKLHPDSILFWNEACTSPKLSGFTFHFIQTWHFKPFLKSSFQSSC